MTKKQIITAIIKDKRGYTLSIGKNSYTKTAPLQKIHAEKVGLFHKEFIHAEIDAIIKCKDLSKAHSISVYRYSEKGIPLLAKPCPICQSAIEASSIENIFFTTTLP